jgi:hypothetical protein
MKLLPPSLAALALSLLAPPALALDQRQADAVCASWTLECPEGATASAGPARKTGALECKAKAVKEGPSVSCKDGKAVAWGEWKAGKKHGQQVTLLPGGAWTEELFAEGKPEGRSVEYGTDGQLLKETHFQAGKKHGPERTFQADGQLATEELWDKGVKAKKPAPVTAAAGKPSAPPSAAKPPSQDKAPAGESVAAPADEAP